MGLLDLFFGNSRKRIDIISLNRDLEILNDCATLIEKTVNPEVFFPRFDLYMEKLSILSDAEKARLLKVTGESLYQKYMEMNTEDKRIESVNGFIDRMWLDTCKKAEGLKTDKGRQNRYNKFYDTLQSYEDKMPLQCHLHYKSLKPISPSKVTKIQILDQKENLRRNGFSHYKYIACSDSCSVCRALDGKTFDLSELELGLNAPPMCENCRCSIAAHEDRKEFDEWLNFVDRGGTSKEWSKLKKNSK